MNRLRSLRAVDLMTRDVLSLSSDFPLHEAARELTDAGVHGAPVVDSQGTLVGVISASDFARHEEERDPYELDGADYYRVFGDQIDDRLGPEERFRLENIQDETVLSIMTPTVVSVSESESLTSVLEMMVELNVHRVIVTDNHGKKPVGIISQSDILKRALLPELKSAAALA